MPRHQLMLQRGIITYRRKYSCFYIYGIDFKICPQWLLYSRSTDHLKFNNTTKTRNPQTRQEIRPGGASILMFDQHFNGMELLLQTQICSISWSSTYNIWSNYLEKVKKYSKVNFIQRWLNSIDKIHREAHAVSDYTMNTLLAIVYWIFRVCDTYTVMQYEYDMVMQDNVIKDSFRTHPCYAGCEFHMSFKIEKSRAIDINTCVYLYIQNQ